MDSNLSFSFRIQGSVTNAHRRGTNDHSLGGTMSGQTAIGRFAVILGLGCLLLAASPVGAEESSGPWTPGKVTMSSITALDAIQMTLDHSPFIRLQEQSAVFQEGLVLQATGQFDTTFLGDLSYQYAQTQLTYKEKEAESKSREQLDERIEEAEEIRDELEDVIDDTTNAREVWSTGGDKGSVTFEDPLNQAEYDVLLGMYENTTENQADIEAAMIQYFDEIISESQAGYDETVELIAENQDIRARMGDVPEVTESSDAALNLEIVKQFRNGISIKPYFELTGTGVRYKDKGYLSDDGGLEIPDAYTTTLGFDVILPLARDRGTKATGANERAAEIDYDASLDSLAFSASTNALDTLVAYWDLVAAQRRLEIQLGSLDVNQKISELTQALIDADELPRAELPRTLAAVAQDQAAVDAAERGVLESRIRLATVMGLEVGDGALAPLASDPFPRLPPESRAKALDSEALVAIAYDGRMDLSSARKLEDSGKVLLEAARINLRPIVDLDLGVSYSNIGENNNAWDGIQESFSGSWAGPSGKIGIGLNVPFGNHGQKGIHQQQKASAASASITAADLERTIALGIALDAASVEQVVQQTINFRRAAEAYREAVEIEMERLRYGTVTVLDTLVTQQRSLISELSLIGAEARYARTLAQLAFDTGRLVKHQDGSGNIDPATFTDLPVQ